MAALITTSLQALPIQAAIKRPQQLLTESQDTYLAISADGIVNSLLRRTKIPKGGRPVHEPGLICVIAPAKLVDQDAKPENTQEIQEVWNERPLFLWNIKGGKAQRIELFLEGSDKAFWSREIPDGKTSIIYDGEPLKPGQSYEWRLTAPFPKMQSVFRVMEQQQRDRIDKELTALKEQLNGASEETIALEKANYFAKKKLWSDALRELYSVRTPSAELTKAIEQIQAHDFCAEDKPNVSASR
jgi:hypothetical protein